MALSDRIRVLIQKERYREATTQWEAAFKLDPHLPDDRDSLRWPLAQAYVKQHEYDKAINIYKPHDFDALSIEQRAELGEVLLFGDVGWTWPQPGKFIPVGRAQCALCHAFSKDSPMADPTIYPSPPYGPHLFTFTQRIKRLIESPEYRQGHQDTEQKEAFPGSGSATSVIEYLAESNVCPSCYITPGFGIRNTQDRESPMPRIYSAPISLTIDEMIAIDTYLLMQERENIPSLAAIRAAYEKFLRQGDRPGAYDKIRLASLYDVKGDGDQAIRLLETSYPVMEQELAKLPERELAKLFEMGFLEDVRFPTLKQRPDIVAKYPLLFQVPDTTRSRTNLPKAAP